MWEWEVILLSEFPVIDCFLPLDRRILLDFYSPKRSTGDVVDVMCFLFRTLFLVEVVDPTLSFIIYIWLAVFLCEPPTLETLDKLLLVEAYNCKDGCFVI